MKFKDILGEVHTVIGNRPARFYVTATELSASSHDATRHWPCAYQFDGYYLDNTQDKLEVIFQVAETTVSSIATGYNATLHKEMIRLGLNLIKIDPVSGTRDIEKGIDEYKRKFPSPVGKNLREEILRLFYHLNDHDPELKLTPSEVAGNWFVEKREVEKQINGLIEKKLLTRGLVGFSEIPKWAGNGSELGCRCNQETIEEIEKQINTGTSSRTNGGFKITAFISYSSLDKLYAGELQRALEPHGVDCFLAHEDIEVSDDWAFVIRQRWNASVVFFTLLSDNFTGSCYCLQESGAWLDEKKIIMPLVISDLTLGDKELKKVVGFLTAVHFVKVQNLSMDETVELILRKLESKGLIRRDTKTA